MRIAVLWTRLSGYLDACLRELAGRGGVELYVAHHVPEAEAPFDGGAFDWIRDRHAYEGSPDAAKILADLDLFRPDVLLVSSWNVRAYRQVLSRIRPRPLRVLGMDNPWLGTLRQRIGVAIAPWFVRPIYDTAFVAGERQAVFARKLGFAEEEIWRGLYCCDHERFAAVHRARDDEGEVPRRFLTVSRLVPAKGLDVLLEAYETYRSGSGEPWPLRLLGAGPLAAAVRGCDGVEAGGFVQPDDLPGELAEAGCFVLASRFEPWGVVIHEAAAAGVPLICSEACGAAERMLEDGRNGVLVPTGDAGALARAMARIEGLSREEWSAMSRHGHELAGRLTPAVWADRLLERSAAARGSRGRG